MAKFRVAVTDFIADDLAPEREELAGLAEVTALEAKSHSDLESIGEFDAVMAFHTIEWTAAILARMGRCKLLVRCGVGYDNVDTAAARSLGLNVANVPDYGTEEIADSAIGMMLSLTRGVNYCNNRLQRGLKPWRYTMAAPLHRLRGRVFGIVGCGQIGTAAAMRAKAIGMDVAFYDPYKPAGFDKAIGVRQVDNLLELLNQSYVVSVHCLLNPETRNLIDAKAIAAMPSSSYLVNTSRGAVVDLNSIPGAIATGQLAGVGIDVFPDEPPPDDHPLVVAWKNPEHPCHDRVILNPHSAFYCVEGLEEMRRKGAANCRRALLGQSIKNIVNAS